MKNYVKKSLRKGQYLLTFSSGEDSELANKLEINGREISLSERGVAVCSIPVKDFSGREIVLFLTFKDMKPLLSELMKRSVATLLGSYVVLISFIFLFWFIFLKNFSSRIDKLLEITELVKSRKFYEIKRMPLSEEGDELGRIEQATIDMALEIDRHIEELSKEIETYTSKAYMDSLTGVFNRQAFDEFGINLIERYARTGRNLSVLMIDFDSFKDINDRYGHQTGDTILREAGTILRESLRETDLVFRYGGEEFIALLPSTPLEGALRAGENIRKRIEEHTFKTEHGEVKLTVSIGVAQAREEDADAKEVIKRADKALYIAKKTGRNKVSAET